jgi:hypothetical protein
LPAIVDPVELNLIVIAARQPGANHIEQLKTLVLFEIADKDAARIA